MTTVMEIKNLTKRYGTTTAVRDVSFTVKAGEVVGFVGLNGAGKSTTINVLLGFQAPTLGEVHLFGENVYPSNAHKSHQSIGFATGDMTLFDTMTGKEYLTFIARAFGVSLETSQYEKLVERFAPQLSTRIKNLSRGNRQKIALIAAFMTNPKLVILDEPSSGLDPLMQQAFLELVREESAKGTTIFMSSHYLNEVVDVCSRILLIKNGALVKDIPADQLEASAGKLVRVITREKVLPPKSAELVEQTIQGQAHTLQFVYKGKALRLQEWLGTLPHLLDVSITDHSAEAAFEDLYADTEARNV